MSTLKYFNVHKYVTLVAQYKEFAHQEGILFPVDVPPVMRFRKGFLPPYGECRGGIIMLGGRLAEYKYYCRASQKYEYIMKAIIKNLYNKFHHLILYGIIGLFSSGIDFAIYTLLVQVIGMQYIMANCFSVLGGITTSFILNCNYNFQVKDNIKRRFIIFLSVGLCGLMLSNFILYACIDFLDMNKIISKLLSIVLVVFFQFLVNKYLTFKPSNNG